MALTIHQFASVESHESVEKIKKISKSAQLIGIEPFEWTKKYLQLIYDSQHCGFALGDQGVISTAKYIWQNIVLTNFCFCQDVAIVIGKNNLDAWVAAALILSAHADSQKFIGTITKLNAGKERVERLVQMVDTSKSGLNERMGVADLTDDEYTELQKSKNELLPVYWLVRQRCNTDEERLQKAVKVARWLFLEEVPAGTLESAIKASLEAQNASKIVSSAVNNRIILLESTSLGACRYGYSIGAEIVIAFNPTFQLNDEMPYLKYTIGLAGEWVNFDLCEAFRRLDIAEIDSVKGWGKQVKGVQVGESVQGKSSSLAPDQVLKVVENLLRSK